MKIIEVDNTPGLYRDMETHAIININNNEYETHMKQREIQKQIKLTAKNQSEIIESMRGDIESMKALIAQLINKE